MNFKQKATLALAAIALTASNLVAAQTTTLLNASYPKATTFGNHLCPPNADAIQKALAPALRSMAIAVAFHRNQP